MSTGSEIDRMPASPSRLDIQAGVGRVGSMSRTTRVTKTSQPRRPRTGARSSTTTEKPVPSPGSERLAGSRRATPVEFAYSRAMPRTESA